MSNLPDDVTPAMIDPRPSTCVSCDGDTDATCQVCDAPLCDFDVCENMHREETGHGPVFGPEPEPEPQDDGTKTGVRHLVWLKRCPFNGGAGCWTCRQHPNFKPKAR